ncbi:hypothetical protein ACEQ8H_000950 [Pleosporales sp. CAS-2024a]
MGAAQSTGGEEARADGRDVRTSYYALLGVERTATRDELKKAYRRKALELHPDRNHGDTQRTTALFAEVQTAYDVLCDDQERAWYDAHEADMLRRGSGDGDGAAEHHVTTPEHLARIMGQFRGAVAFSDAPNGFFGYVRDTFAQLAKEEAYAAAHAHLAIPDYPSFGHKDDTHGHVVRDFYAGWNGFATAKSFAYMDRYRLSDAPDRRTRRAMEKENQKLRDDAKREFNDAVRALLAFVRKRDPRYQHNTKSADEQAKAQRDATKTQAAKARAAQMAKLDQEAHALPDWATARPPDDQEDETEEERDQELYECLACNKTFKSERQYDAHEKSKKHQKALQALQRKMQKDNAHLHLDDDAPSSHPVEETPASASASDTNDLDDSIDDMTTRAKHLDMTDTSASDQDDKPPSTNPQPEPANIPSGSGMSHGSSDDDDDEEEEEADDNDEYAPRSTIQARLNPLISTTPAPAADTPSGPAPRLGAAKMKKLKKAAKQAAPTPPPDAPHTCFKCAAGFPSKTQLMKHLDENPGHAALKSGGGGSGGKGKKKGKR